MGNAAILRLFSSSSYTPATLGAFTSNGDLRIGLAIKGNHLDVIKYLVREMKVDVNTVDINGCTALHLAANHDNEDAARTLLDLNADTTVVNVAGQTAFEFAASCNRSFADQLHPVKHIDGTDASQMRSEKSGLVRRVLESFRQLTIQELAHQTGLTSEEVEIAWRDCGIEAKISQGWVRYMSKAALTWHCEILDGPSWSTYYRVYSEVVRALRTNHTWEATGRAAGGAVGEIGPAGIAAGGIAEALVLLKPYRNKVACHLRENVSIEQLIEVFHLLRSPGGRFYRRGMEEKWHDEMTLFSKFTADHRL
ncbi:uncharacterized protein PpBr36_10402 [Pyricularia pennisetigena]|uniref:uncharacterized protein n=1 Tax=Pyricularia pennisetigena TaxID=1578925 RepID=UPI001151F8E3|nr:uncharacterized protein PpBr36_10402 [Pyricularia pennisetigena]TLS21313.1 hypothetical protein PpBr36_10402 [Pyricularia pennisetigena]